MCHLSVTPPSHLQEVCTCLVLENSMYVLTFTLGLRCFIFHGFFLGPGVLQCVFYIFCMVLPSFLHSLPRLNGLERGVCHLSVPPFARFMRLSCVENSMYVLTFTFSLHCFIFHGFFLGSWSPPVCFLQFLHGSAFIFA